MFKIYKNKKVIITGHTGFKGSWLSIFLKYLGAKIIGISLDCKASKGAYKTCDMNRKLISDERIDICNKNAIKGFILEKKPDFVFHLAAQALVSQSYNDPAKTIETNAIGTRTIFFPNFEFSIIISSVEGPIHFNGPTLL